MSSGPQPTGRPPVPPPATSQDVQLPEEGLPLRQGAVVEYDPQTRRILSSMQWQPGMAIPPDMPKALLANMETVRAQIAASDPKTVASAHNLPETFRAEIPAAVQYEQLTPEARAEVDRRMAAYLQQYQQTGQTYTQQEVEREVQKAVAAPTIPQATASRDWEAAALEPTTDTLPAFMLPPPASPPPATATEEAKTPETPQTVSAGAPAGPLETVAHRCPQCHHSLDQPVADPTPEDIRNYAISVQGGGRFFKTYDIVGGLIRVTFRSLSSKEERMLDLHMREEIRQGRIDGSIQYTIDYQRYRLAMSLAGIEYPKTNRRGLAQLPALQDMPEPADGTPLLTQLADWVMTQAIPQGPQQLAVTQTFYNFNRLYEILGWRALSPGFLTGIMS